MPTTQKLNEDLVFILERQNTILESKKTDSDDYVLGRISSTPKLP